MALVVTPSQQVWQKNEQPDTLINVFLKMWDGKTLCCLIDSKQAAISALGFLQEKVLESYPSESRRNYYFVMQSKPLTGETANLMDWKNGSTIEVQYRNKGGCFIFSFSILCIILMALVGSFCTCGSSLLIIPVLLPFLFILPLFCL